MKIYNREKLSTLVRTYVTGHDIAVSKKEISIHQHVLGSNIKDVGDKVGHVIVSRDYYEDIGKKLGMTKDQVFTSLALLYPSLYSYTLNLLSSNLHKPTVFLGCPLCYYSYIIC